MHEYKGLIFDLGNVIFRYSWDHALQYWATITNLSTEILRERFVVDEIHRIFEKDQITPLEMQRYVSKQLGVELNTNEFELGWNAIYEDLLPGIGDLLDTLKKRYRLVALTNTNSIHCPIYTQKYAQVLSKFEKIFSSHEMKVRKPEKESYEMVLAYLDIPASEVVFLDDNGDNVHAAQELGITSFLVTTVDQMKNDLEHIL